MLGLGKIGRPIGERLAGAFDVVGFDPAVDPSDPPAGIRLLAGPTEIAQQAEIVCLSLPKPPINRAVVAELLAAPRRSVRLILEMSTIGEECAEDCARSAARAGVGYLDCPVSGGRAGASAGRLTLMVAGSAENLARTAPVLARLSSRVIVMGERPGLAQVVKLVNNIINSTSIAITCEAMQYGVSRGLRLTEMLEVVNSSSGRTQASEVKFPEHVLPATFRFGSTNWVVLKDMELYREAALVDGPLGLIAERTIEVWRSFVNDRPGEDTMQIYPYIGDRMGVGDQPGDA